MLNEDLKVDIVDPRLHSDPYTIVPRVEFMRSEDDSGYLTGFPISGKDHYNVMALMYGTIGMLEVQNDTLQKHTLTAEAFDRMSRTLAGVQSVKRIPEDPGGWCCKKWSVRLEQVAHCIASVGMTETRLAPSPVNSRFRIVGLPIKPIVVQRVDLP